MWWRTLRILFLAGSISLLILLVMKSPALDYLKLRFAHMKTVADQVEQYGRAARNRLSPFFVMKGVAYPPAQVVLLYVKSKKQLVLFAAGGGDPLKFIRSYRVLAASGKAGPKLREGDRQVPEGFYRIESLNPNSILHLSLKLNYPNAFDREMAASESRSNMGGDIMIHGMSASMGCVAIGNEAIEELFVLAADTNYSKWEVILSPVDFRTEQISKEDLSALPPWVPSLYTDISERASKLPEY